MTALTIRIDDELHQQLLVAAKADDLSVNREIGWLLDAALFLRRQGYIRAATYVLTSSDAP